MTDLRDDFPILKNKIYGQRLVYLDNAATSQKPSSVIDSISDFYKYDNSNIHRGVHYLSELSSDLYEEARKKVSTFIGSSDPSEITFTAGTTDSINQVAFSLKSTLMGNEVLISGMEHHSNIVPWQLAGAKIKTIPMDEDCNLLLDSMEITDKTKLIAISHVSNVLGTVNDIKRITEIAADHDIPVLVDAAQSIQHLPLDVEKIGCDFLAASGHKMYASSGIGILYTNNRYSDIMPARGGGGMIDKVTFEGSTYLSPPLRYEAGTPNISGAISVGAAIDYMQNIGLDKIREHEHDVYSYAKERLLDTDGITVYGNNEDMCGSISFNIENIHHYDLGLILDKMGIAVRTGHHCAQPLMELLGTEGTVRASFALYNTKEDIDILMDGIEKARMMFS
ncbi:aminotransferase class V-fold PLP-dependent enzyme [Methanosalsum natronophilum]|uniref:aminotransferase class V-fold PLP-dependent enzyme n=1 Tax=Methanosalsum natronophilum TaxID=768733 RepID=UPI00216914DC|nr:cysteine desulfurase [Methanosalsum natronophilum]MCS3923894.1 cysteine desulfurase/selenocysteine lyase [Methanosalsum natronophilum]